jgi:hypothetical protein
MADMKQIFTYPSNSGTDWIDPNYIGDSNSGLTRRADELLAGAYKSWTNLDPVSNLGTTNTELMQNLSKFITYFDDKKLIQNLTFYDFWQNPIVVLNKTLIAQPATIQLGDTNNPATITTTANHEFEDGMVVRLSGLNGSWATVIGLNTDYYVKKIDADEMQISKNSALTDLIGFISTQTIDVTSDLRDPQINAIVQIIFPTSYDYPDGMEVDVNSVEFNGQSMVGGTYYVKESTAGAPIYDLYEDAGLTNPLYVIDIIPFTQESFVGIADVDNAIAKIDTTADPITNNETKGFVDPRSYYAGSGDVFPSSTVNMVHLKSTGTSQVWEMYDDAAFTQPLDGVVNRDREWDVIPYNAGNIYGEPSDSAALLMFNGYLWVKNDVDGITAQPPAAGSSNYNFAQLEGTQLWRGPALNGDNYANLYTNSALTQPISRDSLNPDLFTYANNGASSFPFKTDSLELQVTGSAVPNSPVIAQQTSVWYAKDEIQDYVSAGTRVWTKPTGAAGSDEIVYTDSARTIPVETTSFFTPVDANGLSVDWMPNGTPFDTAVIKIPNRSMVLERIEIQNTAGAWPNPGNLLDILEGLDVWLTHLGNFEYEMYLDAAKTQPVMFDNYKGQAYYPNPNLNTHSLNSHVKFSWLGGSSNNLMVTDTPLQKNELAFWNPANVYSYLDPSLLMLAGPSYYYLSGPVGSGPYTYGIFTDSARTVPYNSPNWSTPTAIANIQPNGLSLAKNGSLIRAGYRESIGWKDVELNIGTITGNGQNFNNTRLWQDPTDPYTGDGYELYTDQANTVPALVTDIVNNNAGLTKTYHFLPRPNSGPYGVGDGIQFYRDRSSLSLPDRMEMKPINEITSVDGDTNPNGVMDTIAARKFIHSDTDVVDTDNKLMSQAGLLTSGTDYYIDWGFIGGASFPNGNWGLFTEFDNSAADGTSSYSRYAKYQVDYNDPSWRVVDPFPDYLLQGDASLDYQLYDNFPLDANGDNILSTHGTVEDDGQSVTLNDPIGHPSSFGWFTITSHNMFSDTIAVNETLRLSPTEKCRYTGYTLNNERLFELVDNNDVKIPVNLGNYPADSVTVKGTDFFPADTSYGTIPAGQVPDYIEASHQHFHAIEDTVTMDRRKPYVFWDASNNMYVGMWTGQKYTNPSNSTTYKNMMFWTKTGWTNSERHLVDTAVPTTLNTQWFALAPTSTRASADTFDYEDAFAFNNIAGEYSTTQTTPNGIPLNTWGFSLQQDYSIDGTEPTTEPGQPGRGNPGGYLGSAMHEAENTGYDQWMLTWDIVVPALARHTLSNATDMLYVQQVTWGSPVSWSGDREQVVAYNPTYNNTDTTANSYYGYFNHGDIIDLPGVNGTGTAPYVLLKRGSNTKLKFKYTTTSTPNPTGTDIVTEDMEGEVWGVIPLTDWTSYLDQTTNPGTWVNNSFWISSCGSNLHTDPDGDGNYNNTTLTFLEQGPISSLPMFSKFLPNHTYPNTYAVSTGAAYTGNVTVRAGNVASGTPYTASQFEFIAGKQHTQAPLNHTNLYKVTEETPWDFGVVPITTSPISSGNFVGTEAIGFAPANSDRAHLKRYISSTETNNLYGYEGRITFDSPNKIATDLTVKPAYQGDVNITFGLTHVDTTQGTVALSPNQPQPYKGYNSDIIMPGNETYSYQDTNNQTVYQANIAANQWYEPGTSAVSKASAETDATFDITVNGTGKLQSVSLNTTGRFDNGQPQLRYLQSPPNQYVPPTPTPAELEDVWDTDDEWASDGFASGLKEWPDHVTPMSAVINYNSPTLVNNSQSGIKYTRSVGHTNWRLEVEYPPMSAEDFQKFHAIAQAAHGQSTPFFFNLNNKDGTSILWKDFYDQVNTTTSPLIKDDITPGDTTMLVEGFSSNEADAFKRGEVFIDGENANGYLHTSLSRTSSNIFGEAKIRTPWPFRTAQTAGQKIYKNPTHAVVTLANDNFEYQVDVNNYYYVSVAFDLDNWK